MNDPGDLSNLRDIVVPPPVPWWPPAPGWWIVGIALLAAFALLIAGLIRRYRSNAYRREALDELAGIDPARDGAWADKLSAILKRAALVAYPRTQVASLTGRAWLGFLNETGRTDAFTRGPGRALDTAAHGNTAGDTAAILAAARRWVKRHRAAE